MCSQECGALTRNGLQRALAPSPLLQLIIDYVRGVSKTNNVGLLLKKYEQNLLNIFRQD